MCDRAWFFGKNPHQAKNDQKWPKNMVFGLFKKFISLVLSGIFAKWKLLWFINVLQKLHAREKFSSQVIAKKCLWFQYEVIASEIPVFFNHQYFTNRLISELDFWHVDRHEWKKQGSLIGFLKKFSFGKMGHFGPKNCTSTGRIFLRFCTMKGLIGRWEWY